MDAGVLHVLTIPVNQLMAIWALLLVASQSISSRVRPGQLRLHVRNLAARKKREDSGYDHRQVRDTVAVPPSEEAGRMTVARHLSQGPGGGEVVYEGV